LFSNDDFAVDHEKKTISISNCQIIPILGILKLMDDLKNFKIKEGWNFTPYSSITDKRSQKPYIKIELFEIRKGE
jgi:hypothetical protein